MSIIDVSELKEEAKLQRFINKEAGKSELRQSANQYGDEEIIKCKKESTEIYDRQGDGTFKALECILYFCMPDTNIKKQDKIDGLSIHSVRKITDFDDGEVSHLEVYGYNG